MSDCSTCGLPRWAHERADHTPTTAKPRDLPDAPRALPAETVEVRPAIVVVTHEIKLGEREFREALGRIVLDPDVMHGAADQFPGSDYP